MATRRLNGVVDRLIRVHTGACADGSREDANAPDLIYLQDTKNTGKADRRRTCRKTRVDTVRE